MINKLTEEQRELMYTVRDEWTSKLGNLKLDRDKAREGIEWYGY